MNETYSNWPNKLQAAQIIGLSTKSIQELAKAGRLQTVRQKPPRGGQWIVLYNPDDVDRIREERKQKKGPASWPMSPISLTPKPAARANEAAAEIIGKAADVIAKAFETHATKACEFQKAVLDILVVNFDRIIACEGKTRIPEKVWLSIPEAADYASLPKAYIRRLVRDGKVTGIKTGSGWRIFRVDLLNNLRPSNGQSL